MKIENICILGEDKRMDYTAFYLYNLGYEIYRSPDDIPNCQALVLPPVYKEDIAIDVPIRVYGGKIVNDAIRDNENADYITYSNDEEYTRKNAELTALGLYNICARTTKEIQGVNVLVVGFGYCGKEIARVFKSNDCNVKIMVRRRDIKKEIIRDGYDYINLHSYDPYDVATADIIINTVPAPVVDRGFIDCVSEGTTIYDIASGEGGTDFDYCSEKGIATKHCLGIPGKDFPKEAGEIIAQYIERDLCINHPQL